MAEKENKKNKQAPKHSKKAVKKPSSEKTDKLKASRMEKLSKLFKKEKQKKLYIKIGLAVIGVYILGVIFFAIFSYPRTTVADTDVSFNTFGTMEKSLAPNSTEYTLTVSGLNFSLAIPGENIDYYFDSNEVVKRVFELKNPFLWPIEIFKVHDFQDNFVVSFDQEKATDIALPAIEKHNSTATPPSDAGFNLDLPTKTASIRSEVIGNTLNKDASLRAIMNCIGSAKRNLELGEEEQMRPSVCAADPRMDNALDQANKALKADLTLTMGSFTAAHIDTEKTYSWLYITPEYKADLKNDALAQWANQMSDTYNTLDKTRSFTTPYGKSCSVSGGTLGWQIDEESLISTTKQQVMAGNIISQPVPCSSSTNGYAGPGGRDWGNRYIDIDLSEQQARMYDDSGNQIWATAIVSGKPDGKHATPTGVWQINSKESPSVLNGENDEYHTKVEYWMPFVGNGIGLHDASWQSSFGGNRYKEGFGSHGCVNISSSSAAALYGICVVGDVVVVHD